MKTHIEFGFHVCNIVFMVIYFLSVFSVILCRAYNRSVSLKCQSQAAKAKNIALVDFQVIL